VEYYRAHRDLLVGMKVRLSRNVAGKSGGRPLGPSPGSHQGPPRPPQGAHGDSPDSLPGSSSATNRGTCSPTPSTGGRRASWTGGEGTADGLGGARPGYPPRRRSRPGESPFRGPEGRHGPGSQPGNPRTDLHAQRAGVELSRRDSKFLALGFPLKEIICLSTQTAARWIGVKEEVAPCGPARGDAVVFRVNEGKFTFVDCYSRRPKELETEHMASAGAALKLARRKNGRSSPVNPRQAGPSCGLESTWDMMICFIERR